MELPFEKTVCRYWKQKLYTLVNREETQEVKLPDSMPDVGRIIASWGQVILRGKDWRGSGLGINGGVMVWVLYAPEDGGALQKLESWIPWKASVDFTEHGDDGVIRVESVIRSVDARALSGRKLMLRTGIGLLVQALVPERAEICSAGELPPDIEVLNRTYPMILTREAGEKTFLLDEELELPDADRLVYYRMLPEVQDQRVMGGRAVFRGTGNLHVLYLDRDGQLKSHDFEIPFAQYMDLEGEYEQDAGISNILGITSLELEPGMEGTLRLKCGMVSQYIVNAESVISLLEDAYSPSREVELEHEELVIPAWLEERTELVDLSQSFPAEDTEVVDRSLWMELPAITRQPGAVTVESGGTFLTVLRGADGSYSSKSVRDSRSIQMNTDCDTVAFSGMRGMPTVRKEGGNWRTDTQVVLSIGSLCARPMNMVCALRAGEVTPPDPDRPSVIIRRRGSHESLWDLAKHSGSTVGAIRKMNKLEGEPAEDKLLLIPVL